MSKKHKSYSDEFKFEVALAALKGNKTLAQLSAEYQLAPSVIQRWKTLVQTMGPKLFSETTTNMSISSVHEAEKSETISANRTIKR